MDARASVANMKSAIATRFPAESEVVDAQMLDYDADAYETWLERFCDTTNEAMAQRDEALVDAHLSFVSQQLEMADADMREALWSYTESLMWNLDVEAKRWAWPRVPANLKQLHVEMWGEPKL